MNVPVPNVSRETIERLEQYAELLRKWNTTINLVSKASIADLWQRHIVDSAQIFELAPDITPHWVDLGSGGGFPGLVIAIMAMETGSPANITLVESDLRKSTFLRSVIREVGLNATVINDRIEKIPPLKADILSARALASLSTLLDFADRHLATNGTALFMKGENWQKELEEAQRKWRFQHQLVTSTTESGPVILKIQGISRV
jgi:16S rRNA (guanine527-N7)-methyltransferase